MASKVTYCSIIAIFITTFFILPELIADSSRLRGSYACLLSFILVVGANILRYKHCAASMTGRCKTLKFVNLLWFYLFIYNIYNFLSLPTGSMLFVYYLLSFTSWVACANLFYILGSLEGKNGRIASKKAGIETIIAVFTVGAVFFRFIYQTRLFLTFGWLSQYETTAGMGWEMHMFKNFQPFLLASLSLGLFFVKKRMTIVVCVVLIVVGILLASKRGPLVGMCMSLLVMVLLQAGLTRKIKVLVAVLVVFWIVYDVTVQYAPRLVEEFVLRFTSEDDVGSGRLVVWSQGFKIWNEWPGLNVLFGGGPGFSSVVMQKTRWGATTFSHSDYLDILYQYGYVGLTLQLLYCWQILKSLFRARKYSDSRYKSLLIYSGSFMLVSQVYTMTYISIVAIVSSIFYFYSLGMLHSYEKRASLS